jgi:hypothetical protein
VSMSVLLTAAASSILPKTPRSFVRKHSRPKGVIINATIRRTDVPDEKPSSLI